MSIFLFTVDRFASSLNVMVDYLFVQTCSNLCWLKSVSMCDLRQMCVRVY